MKSGFEAKIAVNVCTFSDVQQYCNRIVASVIGVKMRRTSRSSFNFDFSLRRLLLQGARAARGSPPLGQRLCDVERGSGNGGGPSGSSSKHDKGGSSGSGNHKVS